MKVKELTLELREFQSEILEHRSLYLSSLKRKTSRYPSIHIEELENQSRNLSRKLGGLRPYLDHFRTGWRMLYPATGAHWDSLNSATGLKDNSRIKGPSLDDVVQALDQIIGRLETMAPEEEISITRLEEKRPKSSVGSEKNEEQATAVIADFEKVTLAWLFQKVPAKVWISCAGFCLILVGVGISIGRIGFVREMLGDTLGKPTQISEVSKNQVSKGVIKSRKAKAEIFFGEWKRFKALLAEYKKDNGDNYNSLQGEYSNLREVLHKDFYYFRPFLVQMEASRERSDLGINNLESCLSVYELDDWERRIQRQIPREVDCFDSLFIGLIESFTIQLENSE